MQQRYATWTKGPMTQRINQRNKDLRSKTNSCPTINSMLRIICYCGYDWLFHGRMVPWMWSSEEDLVLGDSTTGYFRRQQTPLDKQWRVGNAKLYWRHSYRNCNASTTILMQCDTLTHQSRYYSASYIYQTRTILTIFTLFTLPSANKKHIKINTTWRRATRRANAHCAAYPQQYYSSSHV